MLSSALRLGFSRVSMAAKRSLVPKINAGIFVIVLDRSFSLLVDFRSRGTCSAWIL